MTYIPEGYQTVTPYFFCDEPLGFVAFMTAAFDAQELGRTVHEGVIVNLQLKVGTITVMVSQANDSYPAMSAAYYVYVANADESMQAAIDAGATLEMPVMDMTYGDRQGGVRDPYGNIWWVSQRLVEEPYID